MTFVALLIFVVAFALLCVALWNAAAWPRVGDAGVKLEADAPSVSILIPARDEESNVAGCLESALAQGNCLLEVLVYDDHSRDRTAEVVEAYARRDRRVRLVQTAELPDGWCGKTFACARLAAEARGRWLLFLDADARLVGREAAALIAGEAIARGVTLLSCWPRLLMQGFWEGALMPMLNFVVFTLYPAPLALKRDDSSLGLAHGSCVLARRDTYEAVGGHGAVRAELFEDVRLARLWRERGQRGLCLDGRGVVAVRMYRSFSEIWAGFRKNFFPAFRRARTFRAFVALHLFVGLLPFALAPLVVLRSWAWGFAVAALCVLAARVALAWRFGHPLWSAALHPVGESLLVALGFASWLSCRSGRGVEWKGRRYLQTEGAKE